MYFNPEQLDYWIRQGQSGGLHLHLFMISH